MTKPPEKLAKPAATTITQPDGELEAVVDRALTGVVSGRQVKQVKDQLMAYMVSERFSGPLPHPRHMEAYADLIPDGANRLMSMAEKTLQHHIDMEKQAHGAEQRDRTLGMVLGFCGFLALIGGAVLAVYLGAHPSVPIALVGASAIGAIGMFVKGRNGK